MSPPLPQSLIDQQVERHPELDRRIVEGIAQNVDRQRSRGGVRNPEGLFVTMVREASERATRPPSDAMTAYERERDAMIQVETYRAAVLGQLGPFAIARILEEARAHGFPAVNELLIERLKGLGETWPERG